jgi:hypothetical protein
MKTLIRTIVILAATYSLASQAVDVDIKHEKTLIDSFEVVVDRVKRSAPLAREEFHLISDRFKDNKGFVRDRSVDLDLADLLIPGPPIEGVFNRRDSFLREINIRHVEMATLDIIAWLSVMHRLNGILLTEASLDPGREAELMYIYDAQSRDLSNLEQEFDAWLGGPMVYPLYDR